MRRTTPPRVHAPEAHDTGDAAGTPAAQMPLAVWVHDGLVCVTIVDLPRYAAHDGTCRCGGCHASLQADWAGHFY